MFFNGGKDFRERSAISGLSLAQDSRAFGLLDYNRDGSVDLGLVNANFPTFTLLRNRLSASNSFLALRLVGGNTTSATSEWSNRDGIGAAVTLKAGNWSKLHYYNPWQGHGSQNSRTVLLGLGDREKIDALEVLWPSGKKTMLDEGLDAGQLITIYENPDHSPGDNSWHLEPYQATHLEPSHPKGLLLPELSRNGKPTLVTAMATWCESCKSALPQLHRLKATCPQIDLVGFPWDPDDDAGKLENYRSKNSPPYSIVTAPGPELREQVEKTYRVGLEQVALPSSMLLDSEGRVLAYYRGIPTVSDLRVALDPQRRKANPIPTLPRPPVSAYSHPQSRVTGLDVQKVFAVGQ